MLKRVSTALTGGAMILAIGLGASPALATTATNLTVKVTGGGAYTAKTAKTVLTDNGVSVTCTSTKTKAASLGSGKIASGTYKGAAPVKVGTVAKLAFNNCTGPLGAVKTTITATPYAVNANSKTNAKGQTDASISGTKIAVSTGGCTFMVTGQSPGFFTNSKHTLTMTPKPPITPLTKAQLTVSKVNSGCLGVIKNGDHPTFSATFTVSGKISIKAS
jgi:hypothetical protein